MRCRADEVKGLGGQGGQEEDYVVCKNCSL